MQSDILNTYMCHEFIKPNPWQMKQKFWTHLHTPHLFKVNFNFYKKKKGKGYLINK